MKLGDMTDRQLIVFNIGETRLVRKSLDNHLYTHIEQTKKQEDRRWKIYLILFGAFCTTISGFVIALLIK